MQILTNYTHRANIGDVFQVPYHPVAKIVDKAIHAGTAIFACILSTGKREVYRIPFSSEPAQAMTPEEPQTEASNREAPKPKNKTIAAIEEAIANLPSKKGWNCEEFDLRWWSFDLPCKGNSLEYDERTEEIFVYGSRSIKIAVEAGIAEREKQRPVNRAKIIKPNLDRSDAA